MGLDFKKYDIVSASEDKIFEEISVETLLIYPEMLLSHHIAERRDKVMARTLISIMFKEKNYLSYVINNIAKNTNYSLLKKNMIPEAEDKIIRLNELLNENRIYKIPSIVSEDCKFMHEILSGYFSQRNSNYISKKFFLQIILNQNSANKILTLNPFMINELLAYLQIPLTTEENIVRELIDYYRVSKFCNHQNSIEYLIELLLKNKTETDINDKLRFILSNVYQESLERKDMKTHQRVERIVEEPNFDVAQYLKQNKLLLSTIIEKFIKYNMNIKEGRLEELDTKSSAIYAKRIYRKNP